VLQTTAAEPSTQHHYSWVLQEPVGAAVLPPYLQRFNSASSFRIPNAGWQVRAGQDNLQGSLPWQGLIMFWGRPQHVLSGRTSKAQGNLASHKTVVLHHPMKQQLLPWQSQQHNGRSTSCCGCLFIHAAGKAFEAWDVIARKSNEKHFVYGVAFTVVELVASYMCLCHTDGAGCGRGQRTAGKTRAFGEIGCCESWVRGRHYALQNV
jgi:hypothetical protein